MAKYERLAEIVRTGIEAIEINKAKARVEENKARVVEQQKSQEKAERDQIERDERNRTERLVLKNRPIVKKASINILNEIKRDVFKGDAKVIRWKEVAGKRNKEYGKNPMSEGGGTFSTNHEYQYVFEECRLEMPHDKSVALIFSLGERHWYSGGTPTIKKYRIEEENLDVFPEGGSLNLAQPRESLISNLKNMISSAIENEYRKD